jgi:hypothetical protein
MKTKASTGEERDDALASLRLAVERASSEAQYAERRYMAVDPDNRLIASTLEADWEKALRKLETAKAELAFCEQQRSQALRGDDQSSNLAGKLEQHHKQVDEIEIKHQGTH